MILFRISIFFFLLIKTSCLFAESNTRYSFFVAGHIYGNYWKKNDPRIYPRFSKKIFKLSSDRKYSFGVLTGDVVRDGNLEEWKNIDLFLEKIKIPIHFVPGNHDLNNKKEFLKRARTLHKSFKINNDLFIILNADFISASIDPQQLIWFKKELKNQISISNLFVFLHPISWWSPDNEFKGHKPNIEYRNIKDCNFWDVIIPAIKNKNCPAYFFAGDTTGYYFKKKGQLTFIASGMGKYYDNYVEVTVDANKVNLTRINL